MTNMIQLYNNTAYGVPVSRYGLDHGYLDYRALSKLLDGCIQNNRLREVTGFENWELIHGDYISEDGEYKEIFQEYIISDFGYIFLRDHTDEIVHYNEELDLYLWGVTHLGTAWDHVLTGIELQNVDVTS